MIYSFNELIAVCPQLFDQIMGAGGGEVNDALIRN
jgi:hypothetical protein